MIAIVPKDDCAVLPVKRDPVRAIYVRLPDTAAPLHAVGVQPGVARIVAKKSETAGNRRS